jgi:hypothetical protein
VVLVLQDGTEKTIINNRDTLQSSGSETVNVRGTGPDAQVIVYFDDTPVKTYDVDFNTATVSG